MADNNIGFEPAQRMSATQFSALVQRDVERWALIVKDTGFEMEE